MTQISLLQNNSHPIDVVKTRLQVSGDGGGRNYKALGLGGTVSVMAAEEGVASFWKGIPAAWLREASYTSLRLGLYDPIKKAMGITPDSWYVTLFFFNYTYHLFPHVDIN